MNDIVIWPMPQLRKYREGMTAFQSGNFNNPYPKNSLSAKEWQRGWDKAYFRAQKKQKRIERARANKVVA